MYVPGTTLAPTFTVSVDEAPPTTVGGLNEADAPLGRPVNESAIGAASRRPRLAIPVALGLGFVGVNVAGMVLTDFYLGLAVVHLLTGAAAVVLARRWRWVGGATLGLALVLGALT